MTCPQPELACPSCAYELTGISTTNNQSTCPECGQLVTPVPRDRFFTHKTLHKQLAKNLLAPTAAPMLVLVIATLIFEPLMLFGILLVILYPAFVFYLGIHQLNSAFDDTDSSPIKISKILIFVWVVLYLFPGVSLFLYFLGIGIRSFASIN